MTTVNELNITREELAHKTHARATERMRKLEQEMESAFKDMRSAQESMREIGVNVMIEMSHPIELAYKEWAQHPSNQDIKDAD